VQTVRVPIVDNPNAAPKEDFFFNLFSGSSSAVIGNSSALATIIANDAPNGTPMISISNPVVDASGGEANFAITLNKPSTKVITVKYATKPGTAGSGDFTAVSGTLTFAPGQTAQTISVPLTDTTLPVGDQSFTLALSSPVGATLPVPQGTATIVAHGQTPVATPVISDHSVSVSQSAGFAEFVVRLNAPSNNIVSVSYNESNGTALNGPDYVYTGVGTLSFAPGQTVETVRVPIVDHLKLEPNKTFLFNLFSPTHATIAAGSSQTTATIVGSSFATPLDSGTDTATIAASSADTAADLPSLAGNQIDLHLVPAISSLAAHRAFALPEADSMPGTHSQLQYNQPAWELVLHRTEV
jgi:hypothetical protein